MMRLHRGGQLERASTMSVMGMVVRGGVVGRDLERSWTRPVNQSQQCQDTRCDALFRWDLAVFLSSLPQGPRQHREWGRGEESSQRKDDATSLATPGMPSLSWETVSLHWMREKSFQLDDTCLFNNFSDAPKVTRKPMGWTQNNDEGLQRDNQENRSGEMMWGKWMLFHDCLLPSAAGIVFPCVLPPGQRVQGSLGQCHSVKCTDVEMTLGLFWHSLEQLPRFLLSQRVSWYFIN